jgi:hypothetical protein
MGIIKNRRIKHARKKAILETRAHEVRYWRSKNLGTPTTLLEYKLVGKHEPNQFFRVKRVRSHEREALLDARDEPDRPRDAYLRGRVVRKISREGFAR